MGSRVYIGRLSSRVREKDLERFFRGYGKLRDITLKTGYGFVEFEDIRDADDAVYELNGKELLDQRVIVELSRGPGSKGRTTGDRYRPLPHRFDLMDRRNNDNYRHDNYRNDNYNKYDNYRNDDRRPYVPNNNRRNNSNKERYGPPVRTDNRIIVENLSSRVSWQDLKDFMRKAGEVTYADAHRDNKNEGVVEFATYEELKRAMDKLDGIELCGRKIRLVDQSKKRRTRSRSRSRRRSSHSRSGSSKRSRSRSAASSTKRKSAGSKASKSRSRSGSNAKRSTSPVTAKDKKRSSPGAASRSRSGSRATSASPPPAHAMSNGNEDMDTEHNNSHSPAAKSAGSRSPSSQHYDED